MSVRLQKYMADCGIASRRKCEDIILSGRVSVNGDVVRELGTKVCDSDEVFVDGNKITPVTKKIYIMMNKPQGVLTSVSDDRGRTTVLDLLQDEVHERVFPVGRLDVDTEGLLILTNDGKTAHKILSPKNHIPKDYYVQTSRPVTESDTALLEQPMDLGDFITMPAQVQKADGGVIIRIYEGKFHQVKRMFEKTDNSVTYLKRIKMGGVCLDEGLAPGEIRELTADELSALTGEEK